MKIFTTILVVILTIVLGRWFLTFDGFILELSMRLFSMFFVGVFGYGIYKSENYCIICYDKKPSVICTPCLHMCFCIDCKKKYNDNKCPICKNTIENYLPY